jgi:hypothetical protein
MKVNRKQIVWIALLFIWCNKAVTQANTSQKSEHANQINLSGEWLFQVDSLDQGEKQKWFLKKLNDKVRLPGSMATNNKGNDITVHTEVLSSPHQW